MRKDKSGGHEHDSQHKIQRAARHSPTPTTEDLAAAQEAPAYSPSLLSNAGLSGSGNGPVRAALMAQAQRAYGNQATRHWITNSKQSISPGERAVQRWMDSRQATPLLQRSTGVTHASQSALTEGPAMRAGVEISQTADMDKSTASAAPTHLITQSVTTFGQQSQAVQRQQSAPVVIQRTPESAAAAIFANAPSLKDNKKIVERIKRANFGTVHSIDASSVEVRALVIAAYKKLQSDAQGSASVETETVTTEPEATAEPLSAPVDLEVAAAEEVIPKPVITATPAKLETAPARSGAKKESAKDKDVVGEIAAVEVTPTAPTPTSKAAKKKAAAAVAKAMPTPEELTVGLEALKASALWKNRIANIEAAYPRWIRAARKHRSPALYSLR